MTEIWKMIRFGIVGGLATLTHGGVAALLVWRTGLHPVTINTIAFFIAFIVSGLGHIFFSFKVKSHRGRHLARFFVVAVLALGVSNLGLAALLKLGVFTQYVAQIMAILIVPVVSYTASRFWAFSEIRS